MAEDATKKLTFFSKEPLACPLCETSFYKEELLTGGGRMIAGNLTNDLRRIYEPSKKFGEVYPLIYVVTVCPNCLYAALPSDFTEVPDRIKPDLLSDKDKRRATVELAFDDIDFTSARDLKEGAASYFLAIWAYDHFPREFSPTIKQGIAALRGAWTCVDLHKKYPSENYDYLNANFYRKARFFYGLAVEKEQNGQEAVSAAKNLGPDLDKNYGFDGALYIAGLLEFRYGPREDREKRIEAVQRSRRAVARIFGMGRATKNKPSAILDKARDLYAEMGKELDAAGISPVDDEEGDGGS